MVRKGIKVRRLGCPAVLLVAASALVPISALAQSKEQAPAAGALGGIVVTATRSGALVEDQALRIEVVPEEEIEENLTVQPSNLSTLLSELAGVHLQAVAPSLGGTRLQLRGMPGRHTTV